MRYLSSLLMIGLTLTSFSVNALIVYDVKIDHLYVQSLKDPNKSDAHAVRINKSIDETCRQRMYIDPLDKELFSALLAYKMSGTSFNLMYDVGKPGKVVAGHLKSTCKLYSIW